MQAIVDDLTDKALRILALLTWHIYAAFSQLFGFFIALRGFYKIF